MYRPWVSWHITSLSWYIPQTLYNLDKKVSQSEIFNIFECSGEVHQIYLTTSHFSFKVFVDFQCNNAELLYTFLVQILYTLIKRIPLKCKCWDFRMLGQNSWNSSCRFSKHKSVPLQILHHFSVLWHITPLYFFGSKIMYFRQK